MTDRPSTPPTRLPESRLEEIREEASRAARAAERPQPDVLRSGAPGYYGRPVVKPPVWTWEVPAYFFVGGLSGMAAVVALAALVTRQPAGLIRAALWTAAIGGAVVSPVLLTLDLGRPRRFLNMLRVFKWRSAMSVGAWTLVLFGAAAVPAAVLFEVFAVRGGGLSGPAGIITALAVGAAAVSGAVLATYTGVLLGATVIPVWCSHHRLLPVHFGAAGLGSAAAWLELLGHRADALQLIGFAVTALETVLAAWIEFHRRGAVTRPLHSGRSGLLLRCSGVLTGPLPLALRLLGGRVPAAVSFLVGALLSRFGWLAAGRASALDPEATFTLQRGS